LTNERGGIVRAVDALGVALAALHLGAGRAKAGDDIDHAVGVSHLVKIGERVSANGELGVIHANDEATLAEAKTMLEAAIELGETPAPASALIEEVIS